MEHKYLFGAFLLLLLSFGSCDEEEITAKEECTHTAVIEDFTGLSGCGYLFKLENGEYLEPLRVFHCGTDPVPEEAINDPLLNFEFVQGKRVRLAFKEAKEFGTICMKGKVVTITCIEELNSTPIH